MRRWARRLLAGAALLPLLLAGITWVAMAPIVSLYHKVGQYQDTLQAFDRNGEALSFHYHTRWNQNDVLPLYRMPPLLVKAMVRSEDKRFYAHHGVDWRARASALVTNTMHAKRIRGASSITEQVVRMLHPRPRGLIAKWFEGFEAIRLEAALSKEEILAFYLNQVPYASGRRGVVQAARYYFDRDLDTLSSKEILALVVLVRAPGSYDLHIHPNRIEGAIGRLASPLFPVEEAERITRAPLTLSLPASPVDASHFLRYVREQEYSFRGDRFLTTLDSALQYKVKKILDQRVTQLAKKKVRHAAAIVIDHQANEVLAWVVAGKHTAIDILTTPRQPGSAMKPFLYALALERGWTAATVLDDSPVSEAVGTGLHRFRNYSRQYYGKISLREALGNSLNIPALLTIRFVTPAQYLSALHALGFMSLRSGADIYEDGLALGSGEVTPLELAQAYSALARGGVFQPVSMLMQQGMGEERRVFSPEVSSIIGHILSDPWARSREFGRASLLNLPVQTAVKTGTSTDYHDAWAAGYNYRYTVVVWMGNLDRSPMDGITGSTGPALTLRSIFAELTRDQQTRSLSMSPTLEKHDVCADATASPPCTTRAEYFVRGTYRDSGMPPASSAPALPELVQPTDRLRLAYDPRIPAELQRFQFRLRGVEAGTRVRWALNGAILAEDETATYDWPVTRGSYHLVVTLVAEDGSEQSLAPVRFIVK